MAISNTTVHVINLLWHMPSSVSRLIKTALRLKEQAHLNANENGLMESPEMYLCFGEPQTWD
jgi:hypothetical protein